MLCTTQIILLHILHLVSYFFISFRQSNRVVCTEIFGAKHIHSVARWRVELLWHSICVNQFGHSCTAMMVFFLGPLLCMCEFCACNILHVKNKSSALCSALVPLKLMLAKHYSLLASFAQRSHGTVRLHCTNYFSALMCNF